jgi:hypothetical protein
LTRGLTGVADHIITPDIELETPQVSLHGADEFKRYVSELRAQKRDFTVALSAPEAIGRDLVATLTFSGQVVRESAEMMPQGQPFSVVGRISATVRDERISRLNLGYLVDEWLFQIQPEARVESRPTRSWRPPGSALPQPSSAPATELTHAEKIERLRTLSEMVLVRGIHGAAPDLLTEDFVYESPLTHLVGVEVCNRYIRDIREAWQDLQLTLSDEQVQGREVSANFSLNALHAKMFYGVDATFKRFTLRGTVKARLRGDRISRVHVSYFLNEWLRQVGAEQQP